MYMSSLFSDFFIQVKITNRFTVGGSAMVIFYTKKKAETAYLLRRAQILTYKVRFVRAMLSLELIHKTNQLFCGMRHRNAVRFSLTTFL